MGKRFDTRCFLDIKIGDSEPERIVLELFDERCPKACDNFKKLCQGVCGIGLKTGKPLHYQGSSFHRIIKGFIIQGGDFSNGDGTGGESIYGGTFADEDMSLLHDRPFLLSMANRGPNTNGSQFFITTAPAPHLNGKHMVFGHVLSGQEVVAKIEAVPVSDTRIYKPIKPVVIVNCGELIPIKRKKTGGPKKSSKKKKKEKKSKKKKSKHRCSSSSDSDSVKIRPEEIPDIPKNKFLYRPGPTNTNNTSYVSNRDNSTKYKSGRKIKGRGQVRYRTPDSRSGSCGRSLTPEHWHQAARRPRRRSPEEVSRSQPKRTRETFTGNREENSFENARSSSPLNLIQRSSSKNQSDYSSTINRQNRHPENTSTVSSINTTIKRDRGRDKNRRPSSEARFEKHSETLSPPAQRQGGDHSSREEDLRHGYHQRRTPTPPPQPLQSTVSRSREISCVKIGERSANRRGSASKSGRSPSTSSHWTSYRRRKPSHSRSPSVNRTSKRSNVRVSRRDSPPLSNKSVSTRKETSRDRSGSAVRRRLSSTAQSRGDFQGSPPGPPAHLIYKWEERRKQAFRKRDSLLKVSRRRDASPSSPSSSPRRRHSSSSRSHSSPSRLKQVTSTHHSSSRSSKRPTRSPQSSHSPSPAKGKIGPHNAPHETPDQILYDAAHPTEANSPLNTLSAPPGPVNTAISKWDHSPSGNGEAIIEESSMKEGAEKTGKVSETASPKTTGPWTTSRWEADDESGKNAAASGANLSAKISPMKLAIGATSEILTAVPPSVDMDVSDTESDSKEVKKAPVVDSKNDDKTAEAEALVERKPSTQPSCKVARKPKSSSVSSSSSTSSNSSRSSSLSSRSHSISRSRSSRKRRPVRRRDRRSSSHSRRSTFSRRRGKSRSTGRRHRRRRSYRSRKSSWSRRSKSSSERSRRRRRSSSYRLRRRSYSTYSDSSRSSYSSISRH